MRELDVWKLKLDNTERSQRFAARVESRTPSAQCNSVPEVPASREHHGKTMFVRGGNDLLILD